MSEINPIAQAQIDKIAEDCKRIKPLVAIQCITYNHEPYIRDALEGFVMQKTDFPFVAIVHDDASTDGTADIIREYAEKYPDIIKPIYEYENQYSKPDGSLGRVMYEAVLATGAKYVAICEGDDYWIDSLKLQKQVHCLEDEPKYGLCFGMVRRYIQNKNIFSKKPQGDNHVKFNELILGSYTIPTCTIVYRIKIYMNYVKHINSTWRMGDYPLSLYFSLYSKIKFMQETFGVYRVLENSACHFKNINDSINFLESVSMVKKYFIGLANMPELLELENKKHNMNILRRAYRYHNYEYAHRYTKINKHDNFTAITMKTLAKNSITFKAMCRILAKFRNI